MTEPLQWRPEPQPVRDPALPTRVRVYEVAPRDGLQAEAEILPAAVKVELCRRLLATGVGALEVTSFVPPSWIPQLADAEEVAASLGPVTGARTVALVPNVRGYERARAAGLREASVVVSATESFARANLNADVETALGRAEAVLAVAGGEGVPVRAYVSMSFGDPWEGRVERAVVARLAARLAAAGARTVVLSDTIGTGTPAHTTSVIEAAVDAGVPVDRLALHLHDTYGQALGNVQAGLRAGVAEFDSAAGGIGRCPFARGATGNLATEDLVWLLHGLGIPTGIDLDALVEVTRWLSKQLGRPAPSRVATALMAAAANRLPAETHAAV